MSRVRLPPLPSVGELMRLYQLRARKKMAQNFILDLNICRKIVKMAGNIHDGHICEIGPGPGGLTRAILEQNVKSLTLIEKDNRFIRSLEFFSDVYPATIIKTVKGDILRYPEDEYWSAASTFDGCFWDDPPPNFHIIANLPFNVATPLIIRLLKMMAERSGPFSVGRTQLTLTFQKEVGERMVAPIQNKQRCRLSPICQYLADVKLKYIIPGRIFIPEPDVDAAVVHFVPRDQPLIEAPFDVVEKFFRHIFHFRRKYSIRGVENLYPEDLRKELSDEVFRRARVSPKSQCTVLEIGELADMVYVYDEQCRRLPGLFLYNYRGPTKKRHLETLDNLSKLPGAIPPEYKFKRTTGDYSMSLADASAEEAKV